MGLLVLELVGKGAQMRGQGMVGCGRYVRRMLSEFIGINQNKSEGIGLVLISSDWLQLVPINTERKDIGAKKQRSKGGVFHVSGQRSRRLARLPIAISEKACEVVISVFCSLIIILRLRFQISWIGFYCA